MVECEEDILEEATFETGLKDGEDLDRRRRGWRHSGEEILGRG